MAKLAQKGKRVKLLDESASVKELPKQENADESDFDRDGEAPQADPNPPSSNQSPVKKKKTKKDQ